MSEIERFDLVGEYDFGMEKVTDGDYVRYDDCQAALAVKEAELAQARKLNEFWEDQAGSFEAQLMGANKELVQAREKIDLLKSLIDGAKDLVELFETVTPAQRKWKDNWLNKAREALK